MPGHGLPCNLLADRDSNRDDVPCCHVIFSLRHGSRERNPLGLGLLNLGREVPTRTRLGVGIRDISIYINLDAPNRRGRNSGRPAIGCWGALTGPARVTRNGTWLSL